MKLRPKTVQTDRFFLNYKNGKCTQNPIGRNKFLSIPKLIAMFLDLENPDMFTGNSIRHASAQHGRLRSTGTRVEGYIQDKVENKRDTDDLIFNRSGLVSTVVKSEMADDPLGNFDEPRGTENAAVDVLKCLIDTNATVTRAAADAGVDIDNIIEVALEYQAQLYKLMNNVSIQSSGSIDSSVLQPGGSRSECNRLVRQFGTF